MGSAESRATQNAISDGEASAGILHDAIPTAEAAAKAAEASVARVLFAEAQRLHLAAVAREQAASEGRERANQEWHAAADAAAPAQRFIAQSGNRAAWGNRVPPIVGEANDVAALMAEAIEHADKRRRGLVA